MDFFAAFVKYVPLVVIGLIPIMNPLSTVPLYLALTKGMNAQVKRRQIRNACFYAFCILLVFLLLGNGMISLFGISIPGIRVAGGIIILILALRMMFSGEDQAASVDAEPEKIMRTDLDFSFSPLAMPSLAGPGSIAVVMSYGSEIPREETIAGHAIVITGIAITVFCAYLALMAASRIERFLGPHGIQAVTKIMGFLLTCIAVQFIASGVRDFIVAFSGVHAG